MGITRLEDGADEGIVTRDSSPLGSPHPASNATMTAHASKDPMWLLSQDEAIRLCRLYDEEMGIMYPILDLDRTIRQVVLLFTLYDSTPRTRLAQRGLSGAEGLDDEDTRVLKMVLATALIVEGNGQSELGQSLFESVRQYAESSLWGPVNISQLKLLVLVVRLMLSFHKQITAF